MKFWMEDIWEMYTYFPCCSCTICAADLTDISLGLSFRVIGETFSSLTSNIPWSASALISWSRAGDATSAPTITIPLRKRMKKIEKTKQDGRGEWQISRLRMWDLLRSIRSNLLNSKEAKILNISWDNVTWQFAIKHGFHFIDAIIGHEPADLRKEGHRLHQN